MKKQIIGVLAAATCFTIGGGMLTYGATSEQQAKDLVAPYVPSGSSFVRVRTDDGNLELMYGNEKNQEWYEYEVNSASGKIQSFESDRIEKWGGSTVTLGEADAKKRVTDEIPGAEILSVYVDRDDDLEYEVRFQTSQYYGEYTIHPETGVILERDIKIGTRNNPATQEQTISREKAIELAKKQVGGSAVVSDVDLDWERGTYCYKVELYQNGMEYDVYLNAATGEYLRTKSKETQKQKTNGTTTASGNDIGVEKAKQIALGKVSGGRVTKCEPDYENGRRIYEVEVKKDRWEYEFDIDAETGAILKTDKDYDD